MVVAPLRTEDFINTLGVNTHIPYTDGGYANLTNIDADLKYLGINAIRDSLSTGIGGSAPFSSYLILAQEGGKFTVLTFVGGNVTTAMLQSEIALIAQLNTAVPGCVTAVEGANEINNFPLAYNGVSGIQGAVGLQQATYALVHANTALQGVAVDYFTGYPGTATGSPNPQTTSKLADFDTQHPYPYGGGAPYQWVNRAQALSNEIPATGPAVYTETGYGTNGGTAGDVNADVQAKYTLDLLMDDAASGIAKTYLYQLMDAYQPGSPQGDDGFGLFDPANAPKEAATAIHDLTSILVDTAATATTFAPTAVTFSLTNLPASSNSLVMQKSGGTSDIVVWNEPQIWNQATGTEMTAPTVQAVVSLGGTYQTVKVFDPLLGSAAIQTLTNVSSVSLALTDHPLIVEVEPKVIPPVVTPPATDPPVTLGTGPNSIALNISEDAWQGDAQFTVSVDGTQIGGTQTATAIHGTSAEQAFTVLGTFAAGQHVVSVNFLNDAYDYSPSRDRNLYVDSIVTNGVTLVTAAELSSNGARSFTVNAAAATPPPVVTPPATDPPVTLGTGPNSIALNISEDAWQGDAQFTVSVDGTQIGGTQTASALHSSGDASVFVLNGNWGQAGHAVQIQFTNDLFGGSPAMDRNLYVNSIAYNGVSDAATSATLQSNGIASFNVGGTAPVASGPADSLTLHLSEDAWQGNAQFSLSIDGKQISTPQDVVAPHAGGTWQDFSFAGNFGAGSHVVGVSFANDAFGGTSSTDRNLYINGVDLNGQHYGTGTTTLLSNGTASFTVITTR